MVGLDVCAINNQKRIAMKTILTKENRITAGVVVLLIMALIATGIYYSSNKSLTKNLNSEKLKSEMMLSEKLALQKEIDTFKNRINSLSGKNAELDKLLAETSLKLSEKEAQLNRIARENGNIKQLKKQLAEVEQMKKDFDSQVLALNEEIQKLNKEKDVLNNMIASLQEENKQLATNLEILSSMTADNFLVETTKKKDRLTVVARRAKKIAVTFKVPDNIVEDISFKIVKPDGKVVEGKGNGIAYRVVNGDEGLMASNSGGAIKVSRKIEMTYEPKEKQKPGLYQIEMYNVEKYVGTINVKLR
jgi:predicted  nucleic acid-binding Zn-ribbon protein